MSCPCIKKFSKEEVSFPYDLFLKLSTTKSKICHLYLNNLGTNWRWNILLLSSLRGEKYSHLWTQELNFSLPLLCKIYCACMYRMLLTYFRSTPHPLLPSCKYSTVGGAWVALHVGYLRSYHGTYYIFYNGCCDNMGSRPYFGVYHFRVHNNLVRIQLCSSMLLAVVVLYCTY